MGLRTEGVCIVSKGVNLLLNSVGSVNRLHGDYPSCCNFKDVWSKEETSCVSSDVDQNYERETAEGNTRTCRSRTHTRSVRMCAQHTAWERANDAARKGATAEVSDQITTASTQEREREAETSTSTTYRWILTSIASSVGSLCRHTIATSTFCMILILVDQTRVDQTRPDQTRPDQTRP